MRAHAAERRLETARERWLQTTDCNHDNSARSSIEHGSSSIAGAGRTDASVPLRVSLRHHRRHAGGRPVVSQQLLQVLLQRSNSREKQRTGQTWTKASTMRVAQKRAGNREKQNAKFVGPSRLATLEPNALQTISRSRAASTAGPHSCSAPCVPR